MFIILNLGLPSTYPIIMASDFEAGPRHINSNINDGKFYTSLSCTYSEAPLFFFLVKVNNLHPLLQGRSQDFPLLGSGRIIYL